MPASLLNNKYIHNVTAATRSTLTATANDSLHRSTKNTSRHAVKDLTGIMNNWITKQTVSTIVTIHQYERKITKQETVSTAYRIPQNNVSRYINCSSVTEH